MGRKRGREEVSPSLIVNLTTNREGRKDRGGNTGKSVRTGDYFIVESRVEPRTKKLLEFVVWGVRVYG